MKLKKKKKHGYDHEKYITTQEFNKFMADSFTARSAQAKLANKSDVADFLSDNFQLF